MGIRGERDAGAVAKKNRKRGGAGRDIVAGHDCPRWNSGNVYSIPIEIERTETGYRRDRLRGDRVSRQSNSEKNTGNDQSHL
jgi:hypothetical protein